MKVVFIISLRLFLPALARIIPKDQNLILFGSFGGNHFGDNSGALFDYSRIQNKLDRRLIWLTDNDTIRERLRSKNAEVYIRLSVKGIWLTLRTPIIVTSYSPYDVLIFVPYRGYPKDVYLHHGTPLRRAILREKKRIWDYEPETSVKRFKSIYITIATSPWAAQQQQKHTPVSLDRTVITGLPRNDQLFRKNDDKAIKKELQLSDFTILYAPTWRKWAATCFFPFEDQHIENLAKFLSKRNMTIILKPHPTELRRQIGKIFWDEIIKYKNVFKIITINEDVNVQDLLRISNTLITDYSSIHYDYLLLNKPIIYLPYDMKEYTDRLGEFNCDYFKSTPGPKPKTQEAFLDCLDKVYHNDDEYYEERKKLLSKVYIYKDDKSCERVLELIKAIS